MRITPTLIAALLLVFPLSHAWGEGRAAGTPADTRVWVWASVADQGTLQQGNNSTPPSFFDLVPIILFILAGVGIAIVIVAVGLWVAGRGRGRKGQEGGPPGERERGANGENDEWGAKW